MSELAKQLWSGQKDGFQESLHYLKGRREGSIKSFRTPWTTFNDATTDGIEWNSTTVIGGRPATGKTLMKDQIIREGFKLNHGDNFRVLEFSLEMLQRVSAIREYSSLIGKSYKYLCSADGTLSEEHLKQCYEYAKERVKYPIDVVEEPCTVAEFRETIVKYMEHHADKAKLTNTIVTLDHSILLKKAKFESNKMDMLYNLGECLTDLKRKYPIAFIILSQLNRNIDNPERNEDRKYGNYVLESDIFGSDALLQHADTVVGLNRPGKQKIHFYGPDGYIIDDDRVLVMHFLKCRNGDNRMSFFNAEFERMSITERAAPPTTSKK
jgi:replicative DNA helicase